MLIEKTSITTRKVGDVYILDISGKLTLYGGAKFLRETIEQMEEKKKKKIILNLFDTIYVDSSGIGEIVSAFTKVSNLKGSLKLLGLNKRVMDLLKSTKLDTLFQIFDDEEQAVESFR